MQKIPKIIHFVWCGGPMLPVERQQCIRTWTNKNPSWQVRLWYDGNNFLVKRRNDYVKQKHGEMKEDRSLDKAQTRAFVTPKRWKKVERSVARHGGGDDGTIHYLKKRAGVSEATLRQERMQIFDALMAFCDANNIGMFDVDTLGAFPADALRALYVHEMAGNEVLGTNFGATSDIVRVLILEQVGGLYVDSDVYCVKPLGDILAWPEIPRYGLTSPSLSECYGKHAPGLQQAQWESADFWRERFSRSKAFPVLTNSIIAALPQSEGIKQYKATICDNYQKRQQPDENEAQTLKYLRTQTVKLTGPGAARNSLGYDHQTREIQDNAMEVTKGVRVNRSQMEAAEKYHLAEILSFRDNVYFPMYYVVDTYGHGWEQG
jgi:hypothetical protein